MNIEHIKETRGDKLFTLVNTIGLCFLLVLVLYPLVYVLSSSFSSVEAVVTGKVWLWPVDFTLAGYEAVFKHRLIMSGFANSFFYMIVGTLVNVIMTILAAYPLSRKDFFMRNFFMMMVIFTMLFDGGLIPRYLLVKDLGLLDTRWALIIPSALGVWQVIIARTYFKLTIPDEMLDAAHIDGCNDFKFLFKIVLPLSAPILAVISLFYAVGHWNQFFSALIFLKSQSLFPLQLVLNDILVQNQVDLAMVSDVKELSEREGLIELLKYSLIVVASAPVLAIYPFVQRHFVKGVMIGSLKG
ncbi:carbohydrate ABC transporter permease [Paenibacillus sp. 1P07SE]|uniref:carbohydrate ABC transporter permease n=1 Tax=Paenibacillus sp. 1P07SE TaxID=3132209 RepID=UPI0039A7603C